MRRGALLLAAAAAYSLLFAPAGQAGSHGRVEVVVTMRAPALAQAIAKSRVLTASTKGRRLDLGSPTSVSYLCDLDRAQRTVARRIVRTIPSAQVRWRYRVVLDGLAIVLPASRLQALARIPGVVRVWPGTGFHPTLDRSPQLIGADQLWGLPSFSTAGNGVKIGIIDDGIDQQHPFFDPAGYSYPPGFPKGNTSYTTPKVIVARAFAPPSTTWKYARVPFDPVFSEHGTHVAGIAAGDYTPQAVLSRGPLAGVAPKAYLGNYKMNSTPFGDEMIENSAELAAAIEAAVRDGMDVINISYGEIESGSAHNIVDRAVDAAAAAGVVPVVAAGNDFEEFGRGSISSPGTAARAISVAAVSKSNVIASFSSSGPTPLADRLKPDVTAPGVSILSSVPSREGTWVQFSGTSMATPHVAGGAALLRQRHPEWSVAQVKSALVLTAGPAYADPGHTAELPTSREGGGLVNLPRANNPLLFAAPSGLSFGLVRAGKSANRALEFTDAGGGVGTWGVRVQLQGKAPGVSVSAPPSVSVPGRLGVRTSAATSAAETDVTGFVVLTLGGNTRRIPFWFRVERPRLGRPSATLTKPGTYEGTTRGKPARVKSYRYPDDPGAVGVATNLAGPEEVFRLRVRRAIANFGVVLLGAARGVRVTPRLVAAGDENRLLGYRALPTNNNPYLETFGRSMPIVAAVYPARGSYDVVFDTAGGRPGPFSFRFWVNDTRPPSARLVTSRAKRGTRLLVAVSDKGSGVDPATLSASIDSQAVRTFYSGKARRAVVLLRAGLALGRHRLSLRVSDYQEEKNSESVPGVLPNTRFFNVRFTVTP